MKTYEVKATREDKWWVLEVEGPPSVYTQVRRLSDAEAMAREAIAIRLDVPEDSFDVKVVPAVGDLTSKYVRLAASAREESERAAHEAHDHTLHAVFEMQAQGLPLRDIGFVLGVSFQRAHQLAQELANNSTATGRCRPRR